MEAKHPLEDENTEYHPFHQSTPLHDKSNENTDYAEGNNQNDEYSPFSRTTPVNMTDVSHNASFISSTSGNRSGVKPLVRKTKRRRKRLSNKEQKFHLAKVTAAI